ncbi:hypothetical protein ACFPL7_02035 [Dongia soli]|uniref:Uncharacterized protein n=1 Tax=Dongia soli TaxID=600628 RepID=A0ABU5EGE5_9PROT|nr:hypothetical protein [Dongia soli]MDY0885293.1 hypothetical protein [Dongia soli]
MTNLLRPQDLTKIHQEAELTETKKATDFTKRDEDEKQSLREIFISREIHPEAKTRINAAVRRAAEQGIRQVLVIEFPATYCNENGRRINNLESDWPLSLEGFAKKAHEYSLKELKPLGFRLTAQVLDYPGSKPGRVGVFLVWDH